jgi:serine/threonine protein kinase
MLLQDLLQRGVISQGILPGACHLCWVLATAKEFCTAVSYLHFMDVVHGDLKSSNVLLKAAAVTNWDSRGFVAKVRRLLWLLWC